MLQVQRVSAGYVEDIDILHEVSIVAKESSITGVIGPNGSGKSTLLKTMYGFIRPKKGRIVYDDEDITGYRPYQLLAKGISYVPQESSIFPRLSVEDNLQLGGWTRRQDKELLEKRIAEVYESYPNLEHKKKVAASFLSGGELKMLEIGKALVLNPKVILVDEPTAGLAPIFFKEVYDRLRALKEDKTLVLVDQNVRKLVEVSDYIYVLEMGRNRVETSENELTAASLNKIIEDWVR